jgi:hypothetical protein
MFCGIPEFEQPAAVKLERATGNLFVSLSTLGERRVGKLHLHGGDRRHRQVAAIECRRDQRERVGFRTDVDWQAVLGRQFFVELRQRANDPLRCRATANGLQQWDIADERAGDATRHGTAAALGGQRKGAHSPASQTCDQAPLGYCVMSGGDATMLTALARGSAALTPRKRRAMVRRVR